MRPDQTLMFAEAADAADAVRRQAAAGELYRSAAERLRALDPPLVLTCARGSSDHAATYGQYLIELRLRLPALSQPPSVGSIFGAVSERLAGAAVLMISQSGRSPDLLATARACREAGAVVVALVNDTTSPLARIADIVLPLAAGPEKSVAATKSFIAACAALLRLVAEWGGDQALAADLATLPGVLDAAWRADWTPAVDRLSNRPSLFVLGRGLGLGMAQEAALKFKETTGLHAEAFSTAEVSHGPMALVRDGFPVLVFPPSDASAGGLAEQIAAFRRRGAVVVSAGGGLGADLELPLARDLGETVAPIAMIQSFYRLVNAIAVGRGFDPDHPPFLNKVTETQ